MLKPVAVAAASPFLLVAVERVQPKRTRCNLTRHHAVGLDRLAVTVRVAR